MKAFGSEINDFYNKGFPEDSSHDHDCAWLDEFFEGDQLSLVASEKYELADLGWIYNTYTGKEASFQTAFKSWQKTQKFTYLVIQVPKERSEEVKKAIESLGLKIK